MTISNSAASPTDYVVYALTQGKDKKIVETQHFTDKMSAGIQACTFVMQGYIVITLENPEEWAKAHAKTHAQA